MFKRRYEYFKISKFHTWNSYYWAIHISMKMSKADVRRCSSKLVFLKISQYLQETPVLESLANKVADLKACNFIKKILQHRCFHANIGKFLRIPFSQRNSGLHVEITREAWKKLHESRSRNYSWSESSFYRLVSDSIEKTNTVRVILKRYTWIVHANSFCFYSIFMFSRSCSRESCFFFNLH